MAIKWFCISGKQIETDGENQPVEKDIHFYIESQTKQKAPVQASMAKTLYLLSLGDDGKVSFEFPQRLLIQAMDKNWNPKHLGNPPEDTIYVISPYNGNPLEVKGFISKPEQPSYYVLLKGRKGTCDWLITDVPGQYGNKGDLLTHRRQKYLIVDIIPLEWGPIHKE